MMTCNPVNPYCTITPASADKNEGRGGGMVVVALEGVSFPPHPFGILCSDPSGLRTSPYPLQTSSPPESSGPLRIPLQTPSDLDPSGPLRTPPDPSGPPSGPLRTPPSGSLRSPSNPPSGRHAMPHHTPRRFTRFTRFDDNAGLPPPIQPQTLAPRPATRPPTHESHKPL